MEAALDALSNASSSSTSSRGALEDALSNISAGSDDEERALAAQDAALDGIEVDGTDFLEDALDAIPAVSDDASSNVDEPGQLGP